MATSNSSKKGKRKGKIKNKGKEIALVTCFITVAMTVILALGNNGFQTYQMYKQDSFQIKNIRYQEILKKTDEIRGTIIDLRDINEKGRMTICGNPYKLSKEAYEKEKLDFQLKRVDAEFALVKAFVNSQFILNQNIYNETKKYVQWDEGNKNLCTIDDEKWKEREGTIDMLLNNFIEENS